MQRHAKPLLMLFALIVIISIQCCSQERNNFIDGTVPAEFPVFLSGFDDFWNRDTIDKDSVRAKKIIIYFNRCVDENSLLLSDFEFSRNASITDLSECIDDTGFDISNCLDPNAWEILDFEGEVLDHFEWSVTSPFEGQCPADFSDRVTLVLKDTQPPVLWQWPPDTPEPEAIFYHMTLKQRENGPLIDINGNESENTHTFRFFVVDGSKDQEAPQVLYTYPPNNIGFQSGETVGVNTIPLPPHYPLFLEANEPINNLIYIDTFIVYPDSSYYPPDMGVGFPYYEAEVQNSSRTHARFPKGLSSGAIYEAYWYLEPDDFVSKVYDSADGRPDTMYLNRPPIQDLYGNRFKKVGRVNFEDNPDLWEEYPEYSLIYKENFDYSSGEYEKSYPLTIRVKTAPIQLDSPAYNTVLTEDTNFEEIIISGKTSKEIDRIDLGLDYWEIPESEGGLGIPFPYLTISREDGDIVDESYIDNKTSSHHIDIGAPVLDENGKSMVYWKELTDSFFQLFMHDLDTDELQQITDFTIDEDSNSIMENPPDISNDASKVVFLSTRDLSTPQESINPDGEIYLWDKISGIKQITADYSLESEMVQSQADYNVAFGHSPNVNGNLGVGQTFLLDERAKIISIKVMLKKVGNPTDKVKCDIYSTQSDGIPSEIFASSNNEADPSDIFNEYVFEFNNMLDSGKYAFVLRRTGDPDDTDYYETKDTENIFVNGAEILQRSSGSQHWSITDNDLFFTIKFILQPKPSKKRPIISGDGNKIFFWSNGNLTWNNPDGSYEIFSAMTNDYSITQLTDIPDAEYPPEDTILSTDDEGDYLAFVSRGDLDSYQEDEIENSEHHQEIFLVEPSGNIKQITDSDADDSNNHMPQLFKITLWQEEKFYLAFLSKGDWAMGPGNSDGETVLFLYDILGSTPDQNVFIQAASDSGPEGIILKYVIDRSSIAMIKYYSYRQGANIIEVPDLYYIKPEIKLATNCTEDSCVSYPVIEYNWYVNLHEYSNLSEGNKAGIDLKGNGTRLAFNAYDDSMNTDIFVYFYNGPFSTFSIDLDYLTKLFCNRKNIPLEYCRDTLFDDLFHMRLRAKAYSYESVDDTNYWKYHGFDELAVHFDVDSDSDNDGTADWWENEYGLSSIDDGIWPEGFKGQGGSDDIDKDGLTNFQEYNDLCVVQGRCTDPLKSDTDSDGIPDGWEYFKGTNPVLFDSKEDPDNDGLINREEYQLGTLPLDWDTDNDGMGDGWEIDYAFDPKDPSDAVEDPDNDGLTNLQEFLNCTNPFDADTDDDDMPDGWEVLYRLNPLSDDSQDDPDGDGLINILEYTTGTSPRDSDTDDDGWNDFKEVNEDTDPFNPDEDDNGILDGYQSIFDCFQIPEMSQ